MKTKKLIHCHHTDVLYVKRGRRYHPINDPYAFDGLGEGHWTKGGVYAMNKALGVSPLMRNDDHVEL